MAAESRLTRFCTCSNVWGTVRVREGHLVSVPLKAIIIGSRYRKGECIMRSSRFAWVLMLSLGFTLIPTILVAQQGPANTGGTNPHPCRYAGQRCSSG